MRKSPAIAVAVADRQACLPLDKGRLRRAVRAALAGASVHAARISLAVVDDPTIARLNERFLKHRGPTDVLSFLFERAEGYVDGEVVVSAQTARREARRQGWTPEDELLLYVVHGALHLAGYDDATARQRARMRAREKALLDELRGRPRSAGRPKGTVPSNPQSPRPCCAWCPNPSPKVLP
jgi:probable rRNA maturation factor